MEQLIHLKATVVKAYLDLDASPVRKPLTAPICRMFYAGLIKFDETYEAFIGEISNNAALFDWWLNIQLQIVTDLENQQGAWEQLGTLFKETIKGTLPQNNVTFDTTLWQSKSFLCALAIRIYVDSIVVNGEVVQE